MKKLYEFSLILIFYIITLVKCDYYSIQLDRSKLEINKKELLIQNKLERSEGNLYYTFHSEDDDEKLVKLIQNKNEYISAVPVLNYFNVQYYGSVFMGSLFQELSVIFDTGSNILWVSSNTCKLCRNYTAKYSPNESETFKNLGIIKNITYAIGYVNGTYVEDDVFISKDLVSVTNTTSTYEYSMGVNNLKFLLVDDEKFLDGTIADGILGLGIDFEGDFQNSFVYMLYKQGKIKSPFFSFYLTDGKRGSRLYLGDIRENISLNFLFDDMNHCEVNNKSRYWMCQLTQMKFSLQKEKAVTSTTIENINNTSSEETLIETSSLVIFDTGTSYLIIPATDFIFLLPQFTKQALNGKCGVTPYLQFVCQCNSPKDFNDIILGLQGPNGTISRFKIISEDMIEFYPTSPYQCQFEILIDIFMMDAWILGDTVLRNSLVTFDMSNKLIGWVQLNDRLSDNVIIKSNDIETVQSNNMNYIWYFLALVAIITIAYGLFRVVNSFSHRNGQVDPTSLNA